MVEQFSGALAGIEDVVQHIGDRVSDVRPPRIGDGLSDCVLLYVHGGARLFGAGESGLAMARMSAAKLEIRSWAVDYRMPPDHPFPVPLDDCVAAYRRLLNERSPGQIALAGLSAGGNLAAAMLLRAKQEGLPMPGALVLLSSEVDLTESGDTLQTLLGVDTVLTQSLGDINRLYAGGSDLRDPLLSPLFGDLEDFPPTLLQSGTRDLFLSNTVRMHRALGGGPRRRRAPRFRGHAAWRLLRCSRGR